MYSSDLNDRILEFMNRAQTKLGELAIDITNKISRGAQRDSYASQVQLGFELDCFCRSMDNLFNDWTEKEIEVLIGMWTAKANLNQVPYFEHQRYNVNIQY